MSDTIAGPVSVGGIFAAAARAIGAAPGVFLLVWALRLGLEVLTPLLRAQDSALVALGTWLTVLAWACGFVVAMVSGLLIRWLLRPRRDALRLDIGLAVYVILIRASSLPLLLVIQPLRHRGLSAGGPSSLATSAGLATAASLGWYLVMAALALWPIALLMGDPIKPRRAVQLMAPVYWPWLATLVILELPVLAWTLIPPLLHVFHRGLGERMVELALTTFTTTVATFALAYVYASRVRGMGLPGADGIDSAQQAA